MPPAPELPGNRVALVVATGTYADSRLDKLRAPANDVVDMARVLADPEIGGFTVTDVVDRPEFEIRRRLDEFLAERHKDDLVVVYLSCHGVLDARGRLFFAATDTTKDRLSSTAVESTWLLDRLEECRARRQVLILDCCFSGAFANTKGGNDIDLERRLVGAGRGRAVLTASRAGEYSYEGDPLADRAETRSVFTANLVEGLRTGAADHDNDGYVTVEEAFRYAANRIRDEGGEQNPQHWLYAGEDAIVLARNPRGVVVTPAALPEALTIGLHSPFPDIRLGAVKTLGAWLTSADPGQTLTAQQTLHLVASEDSPAVARAARELLDAANPTTPPDPAPDTAPPAATAPEAAEAAVPTSQGSIDIHANTRGMFCGLFAVAFSPDGRLLASVGEDLVTRLWDPATGDPVGSPLRGHNRAVRSVVFSPDGRLLATGGSDSNVRLWDPVTGEQVCEPLSGQNGYVHALAFSPDGQMLVSGGGGDRALRRWSTSGHLVGQPMLGHTGKVRAVAFAPDGRRFASAGDDLVVRLWDPVTGQRHGEFTGHTNKVTALAFSPNGMVLATVSYDRTLRLWDPVTGEQLGAPVGLSTIARAVAFSPDGRLLCVADGSQFLRLWTMRDGLPVEEPHELPIQPTVYGVAFAPDGNRIAVANDRGYVYVRPIDF